jgi:hypothetical protein
MAEDHDCNTTQIDCWKPQKLDPDLLWIFLSVPLCKNRINLGSLHCFLATYFNHIIFRAGIRTPTFTEVLYHNVDVPKVIKCKGKLTFGAWSTLFWYWVLTNRSRIREIVRIHNTGSVFQSLYNVLYIHHICAIQFNIGFVPTLKFTIRSMQNVFWGLMYTVCQKVQYS